MTLIKLELFHADWCGHCESFLPEWKQFKSDTKGDKLVQVVDYEHSSTGFNKVAKVNGGPVKGFPTVKVTFNGEENVYEGRRTAADLHKFVMELKKTADQSGGSRITKPTAGCASTREPMTGGSVNSAPSSQMAMRMPDRSDPDYSRKILLYKIAKYEHKYNTLYNDLRKKGIL
jgi:thiol-disulfide isomerase/thioredoxin